MRIVSGTLRLTPLPWLPVLSHFTPPHIRRMAATNQLLSKIKSSTVTLPLISDIESHPGVCLTSRRPVWLEESQQEEASTGRSVTSTEMDWRVGCFRCSKPLPDRRPFHCTSWFRPTSTLVVNVEPLLHPSCSCGASSQTTSVTHCERLSRYEISPRSVGLTFGWWGSYCLTLHAEHTLTHYCIAS